MRAALTLALLGVACNNPQQKEPAPAVTGAVLATVNDRALTEEELALQPAAKGHPGAAEESKAAILEAMITEELAAQKARELGLKPDARGQQEIERAQAELAVVQRRALADAWYAQQAEKAAQVSDAELQQYYQAHAQELRRQVHVYMSLKRSEAEVGALKAELSQGKTLEEVLKGPQGEGRPYDQGWLSYPQLPPQWRPVLAKLKPGEVSGVIAGDHGRFWLIQLVEEREGPELSFEAEKPVLRQVLAAERTLPAREAAEAALHQGAHIVLLKKPAETAPADSEP